MRKETADIVERILAHLIEINRGSCSITDAMILAEQDPSMQQVLTGLLYLHENLVLREKQQRRSEARLVAAREAAEAEPVAIGEVRPPER